MSGIKLTFFLKSVSKPICISVDENEYNKCLRYVRKILKTDGIIEIQTQTDTLFFNKEELVACLIVRQ